MKKSISTLEKIKSEVKKILNEKLKSVFIVILIASAMLFSQQAEASHFRGGTITWRVTSGTTVEFTVTTKWRIYAESTPSISDPSPGGYSRISNVLVSRVNGVGTRVTKFVKTFSTNGPHRVSWGSCCRIGGLQNGGGYWTLFTIVDLSNGNENSPVSSLPPIVNVPDGSATATFSVPANDSDGDILTYRLANSTELRGTPPPGMSINPSTGQITVNTSLANYNPNQLWFAGVVISDGHSEIFTDFLLQITNTSTPPVFNYPPTPADGTVYQTSPGQPIQFQIQGVDPDAGGTIQTLFASGLPGGASFNPSSGNPATSTFSWNPNATDFGTYVLNFVAQDNVGVQSSTSVTIQVSLKPIFDVPPTPATGSHNIVQVPGSTISYTVQASDPDPADVVQIVKVEGKDMISGNPIPLYSGASFSSLPTSSGNPTSGTFSWTTQASDWGHKHVFFTARDSYGDETVHEVYQLLNTVPTVSSTPDTQAIVGQSYTYNIISSDPDILYGDEVDFVPAQPLPAWLSLTTDPTTGTAVLSGTPALGDIGPYNISLLVEDINHHHYPTIPTHDFTINVTGIAPDIVCPNDITLSNDQGECEAIVTFEATDSTGIPESTITYSVESGSNFEFGTTTVTATATNAVGTSECTFTVTINDEEDPVPTTANLPELRDDCNVTLIPPTAMDNCDGFISATTTHPLEYTVPGNYMVEWLYEDSSGNSVSQTQNVVINGIDAPVISGDPLICDGSVTLSVTPEDGFTYCWQNLDDNIAEFVNVGQAEFSGNALDQRLKFDNSGTPYVVFKDVIGGKTSVMKYNGSNWVYVGNQGFTGTSRNPSLTFDPNNNPIVAFTDDDFDFKASVMQFDGTIWKYIGSRGISRDYASDVEVVINEVTSEPYIAFRESRYPTYVRVMKFNENSNSWEYVGNTDTNPVANPAIFQKLAFDTNGVPYLAFRDGNTGTSVKKYNGSNWVFVGSRNFGPVSNNLNFSISTTGELYVAFADYTTTPPSTSVMKYNDNNWSFVGDSGFTPIPSYNQSFVLDSNDIPIIAYRDDTNSNRITLAKFNGNDWTVIGLDTSQFGTRPNTSLALDNNDIPYIAYRGPYGGTSVLKLGEIQCTGEGSSLIVTEPGNYMVTANSVLGCSVTSAPFEVFADEELPIITCTEDINGFATSAAGTVVDYDLPEFSDNCNNATLQLLTVGYESGATFPIGDTTVTYEATDASGNAAQCSFVISVVGVAPEIECPANILVSNDAGQCGAIVAFEATESTAIPASTITYSVAPGTYFSIGETIVTATATNAVGSDMCTFTVTVVDNEAPQFNSPSHVYELNGSYQDENGGPDLVPLGGTLSNTGYAFGPNQGLTLSNAINAEHYAIDITVALDELDSWKKIIDFKDLSSDNGLYNNNKFLQFYPYPNGPDTIFPPGIPVNVVITRDASTKMVTGSVNGITQISFEDVNDDAVFNSVDNIIHFMVDDIVTNQGESTSGFIDRIVIYDNPSNVVPSDISLFTDPGECGATVTLNDPVLSDNCSDGEITITNDSPDFFPIGTTLVTWTATDSNNNVASFSQNITIIDNEVPSIDTEASDLIVECDGNGNIDEFQTWLDANGGAVASDNCGDVTWANNCENPWQGFLNVFDLDENLLTQDFADLPDLVVIIDNNNTSITLKPNRLSEAPYDASWINPDGSGNRIIDAVTFASDDSLLGQPFSFNGTVTSNTLDASYDSYAFIRFFTSDFSSFEQITSPLNAGSFSVVTDGSIAPPGGHIQYGFVVRGVNVNPDASYDSVYDDLGSIEIQAAECVIAAACGATGTRTVTFTATDAFGNSSTTMATFTIEDTTAPEAVCKDITVTLDENGEAFIAHDAVDNGSSDTCGTVTYSTNITAFTCDDIGEKEVILTVTDDCGNTSSCTATVTVEGIIPVVTIERSLFLEFCQGAYELLTASSDEARSEDDYVWETADGTFNLTDDASIIEVGANGTYSVTVTSDTNCSTSETFTITDFDAEALLSSYTLLATDEIHLHGNNTVSNGALGVLDNDGDDKDEGDIKIHDETVVAGFAKAADIDVHDDSSVGSEVLAPADVELPTFYYNMVSDNDSEDITVEEGETVTLNGNVYGKVDVKEGGTLIFNNSNVFLEELKTKEEASVSFLGSTNLYVNKKVDIDKDNIFNGTGDYTVVIYAEYDVEVKEGSNVTANIYSKKDIDAKGKDDNLTTMTGLFIAKKIKGNDYVNWGAGTSCSPAEIVVPEIAPDCECKGGITALTFEYSGGGIITTNSGSITNNGDGTYTVTNDGEKLEKNFEIFDGTNLAEIHTSCSQDILGVTFEDVTVLGYTDNYGNMSSVAGCTPAPEEEEDCECKGGITALTFSYEGTYSDLSTNSGIITDNGDGTYTITNEGEKIEKNLKITNGSFTAEIHTSCSQDILGQTFPDGVTVISHVDNYGNTCSVGSTEAKIVSPLVPAVSSEFDAEAYPIPSNHVFTIRLKTPNTTDRVTIQIFDLNNRQLSKDAFNYNDNYQFGRDLPSGIYYVTFTQGKHIKTLRVVKY